MKTSFALLTVALFLGFGAVVAFALPDATGESAAKSCCAAPAVTGQPAPKAGMACHPATATTEVSTACHTSAAKSEAATSCHESVAAPKAGKACHGEPKVGVANDSTSPHQH